MTNAMPDGVDGYHRQMADRERRGEEPGFKSHASKPDHPTPYRVRVNWLRKNLPGLHVGLSHTGTWHVLDARYQRPLCSPTVLILEDGPIDSTGPNVSLCSHCVRKQGDSYGEW